MGILQNCGRTIFKFVEEDFIKTQEKLSNHIRQSFSVSKAVMPLLILPLLVMISLDPLYAQLPADTTRNTPSAIFAEFNLASDMLRDLPNQEDSMLANYFFYDPLKKKELLIPVTGNPGSSSLLFFDHQRTDKPLYDGFNQFIPYSAYPLKSFPSHYSERRFTNLDYHIGSKKEQHILVSHEQKIKPWFIAGLDFGALSSQGDFSRTLRTNRNFDVYVGYEAPSKVYRAYASFTSNRVENQENGGISSDSVFENASSLDTRTLPINLQNASIRHKGRDYFVKQDLNLTRIFDKADSTERLGNFETGSLVLNYSAWWSRKSILFTSQAADSGYFENYFVDSIVTYDSSFYNDLYQIALLEYTTVPFGTGATFKVGGGFEYQVVDYESLTLDSTVLTGVDTGFNTGAVVVTAGYNSKRLHGDFFYSKSVYGDIDNSYRSKLSIGYDFGAEKNLLYLKLSAGKIAPTARERLYFSNHFYWNNNFELLEQYDVAAGVVLPPYKLKFGIRSRTSKNLVFYREDYLPQAFSEFVTINEFSLSKSLIYRKFGMDTKIIYSISGNDNVLPVSPLSVFAAVFYQNRFFKNVLGFKAGFDVSYYAAYNGYGYMPATGIFYVQQQKEIGDYPLVGVFVNLKIKSKATLFIRLDHANAGIGERTYYGAYHYPLPGRTFKFGVSWDLVD